MRHLSTVFAVVAVTTLIFDVLWTYLQHGRSWRRSLLAALIACAVWIVIVGVWRNQHIEDFPARYSTWFNFALPALPALPGAVVGLFVSAIVQVVGARHRGRSHFAN